MSRSIRTARKAGATALGAAALSVAALLATGCSAGQTAQTANERPAVEGNFADVGPIALRNVLVAYPPMGQYQAGQNAPLQFDVASSSLTSDVLVSIHTDAAASVLVTPQPAGIPVEPPITLIPPPAGATPSPEPVSQQITVPPGGLVSFGRDSGPQAVLINLSASLIPGQNVSVTFTFAQAGSVTVVVPVSASAAVPLPSPTLPVTGQS